MNNIVIALASVIVYSAYRFGRFSARMDQRRRNRVGEALRDGLVDGISSKMLTGADTDGDIVYFSNGEEWHIHG